MASLTSFSKKYIHVRSQIIQNIDIPVINHHVFIADYGDIYLCRQWTSSTNNFCVALELEAYVLFCQILRPNLACSNL